MDPLSIGVCSKLSTLVIIRSFPANYVNFPVCVFFSVSWLYLNFGVLSVYLQIWACGTKVSLSDGVAFAAAARHSRRTPRLTPTRRKRTCRSNSCSTRAARPSSRHASSAQTHRLRCVAAKTPTRHPPSAAPTTTMAPLRLMAWPTFRTCCAPNSINFKTASANAGPCPCTSRSPPRTATRPPSTCPHRWTGTPTKTKRRMRLTRVHRFRPYHPLWTLAEPPPHSPTANRCRYRRSRAYRPARGSATASRPASARRAAERRRRPRSWTTTAPAAATTLQNLFAFENIRTRSGWSAARRTGTRATTASSTVPRIFRTATAAAVAVERVKASRSRPSRASTSPPATGRCSATSAACPPPPSDWVPSANECPPPGTCTTRPPTASHLTMSTPSTAIRASTVTITIAEATSRVRRTPPDTRIGAKRSATTTAERRPRRPPTARVMDWIMRCASTAIRLSWGERIPVRGWRRLVRRQRLRARRRLDSTWVTRASTCGADPSTCTTSTRMTSTRSWCCAMSPKRAPAGAGRRPTRWPWTRRPPPGRIRSSTDFASANALPPASCRTRRCSR